MIDSNRRMWSFPWSYKESIAFVSGTIVIGFLLQLISGKFDLYLLSAPVNLIGGGIMVLLLALFSIKRKTPFYLWFSGVPFSVTLIGAMLFMGIVMGLIPQAVSFDPLDSNILSKIGLRQITSFWPFIFTYLLLLLSLGALIVRRLINFKIGDYAFYLNHTGLWLLLFAAGLGSADTKRFVMHVQEGELEWRVYNSNGDVVELPIAIRLNDFILEEYPTSPNVDSTFCVVMTQPEPKRFVSQIDLFTEEGKEYRDIELEVNKPLRAGCWMVYQYGYDNIAGKMSTYSSLELVYDPWLCPVYTAIILMALGAVTMFWQGVRRRKSP